jgi:N-acyl-D-aspartate/D-glutamate deacylase
MKADVVVFDPDRIIDKATFTAPHAYAEGVEHVLVNGVFVVDEGKVTKNRPGKVLRHVVGSDPLPRL